MLGLVCAMDALVTANWLAGRELYRASIFATEDAPLPSFNGFSLEPVRGIDAHDQLDTVFACAGADFHKEIDPASLAWLRRLARHGAGVGSLTNGAFILAKAGLLDGFRCATHWQSLRAIEEGFPDVVLTRSFFEIDRDRYTCAGGVSSLDLMLHLIAGEQGADLALRVAKEYVHDRLHEPTERLQLIDTLRLKARSPKLWRAIELMERHLDRPLAMDDIAAAVGVSSRQLSRLFRTYTDTSPRSYYRSLRLKRARALLHNTPMSLMEVALATGFASQSHFSRTFRGAFGRTPSADRKNLI